MVAIQTLFTFALAALATAAPAVEIRDAQGSINTNLVFFQINTNTCNAQYQLSPPVSVFNPPLDTPNELYATNQCYKYQAWGSVQIQQIGKGCTFVESFEPTCTKVERSQSTAGCLQGLGLDAYYMVKC
ncbi:hypothetical protein N431DRAFT_552105 [Stipitochalara longipes BDJ]|nr:hypothetical protein N431DRAFT_552105 [Stipitochalara longipes BDJ]